MTLPDGHKAVIVRIHGRVQRVWFRVWTQEQATAKNLDGWVRNRKDGTVEALFRGPAQDVQNMISLCYEGPQDAHVETIEIKDAEGICAPGFERKPTV